MPPFSRHPLQLSAVWMLASASALFANPFWPFGWGELAASVGPSILGVDRRIRPALVFAVGLPVIAWLCLRDTSVSSMPRGLVVSAIFVVGVLLVSRVLAAADSDGPSETSALEDFGRILEKEFGRARRHERGFAILSLAIASPSRKTAGARGHSHEPPRDSTGDRGNAEIAGLLARELHVYSDVVVARHRVLALVPEVEDAAAEALVKRVHSVLARELAFAVQVGVACFPRDALCVEDLIAAADRDRADPKLQPAPDPEPDLDREVQG